MANIRLITATINGKRIAFSSETVFCVQVSKSRNSKSGYKHVKGMKGQDFEQLVEIYKAIEIGNGLRKRIVMNGETIIRQR